MRRPCLGFHDWRAVKWGIANLDSRACRRCARYEVYAYGSFRYVPPVRVRAVDEWRKALEQGMHGGDDRRYAPVGCDDE